MEHSWSSVIFYTFITLGICLPVSTKAVNFRRKDPTKELLDTVYKDVNGYTIKEDERNQIVRKGGEPTYGEITYESAQKLLHDLKLTYNDVFYDLGSGVGKMVVQTYLTTPVKKATGVELATTRAQQALKAKDALSKIGKLHKNRDLEFYIKSIIEVPLDDATVIYMCSTCFSPELMKALTDKFV